MSETALPFDQMLPRSLVRSFADAFDRLDHVASWPQPSPSDREIWERAGRDGSTVVTRDADFQDFLVRFGPPPKIVWLRFGNCTVTDLERTIQHHAAAIREFHASTQRCLIIPDLAGSLG